MSSRPLGTAKFFSDLGERWNSVHRGVATTLQQSEGKIAGPIEAPLSVGASASPRCDRQDSCSQKDRWVRHRVGTRDDNSTRTIPDRSPRKTGPAPDLRGRPQWSLQSADQCRRAARIAAVLISAKSELLVPWPASRGSRADDGPTSRLRRAIESDPPPTMDRRGCFARGAPLGEKYGGSKFKY
jgi:hypothetical protein